jgi:hypothetical protein
VFSSDLDTGTVCKATFPGPRDLLTDHTLFHITVCSGLCFMVSGGSVAELLLDLYV